MRSTRSWRCAPCTPHSGSTRPTPRRADVLIECSRCHAVFSLQDGIAAAGARFKVQCGRCLEVFETVAAPRTHPPPPPDAAQAEPALAAAAPSDPAPPLVEVASATPELVPAAGRPSTLPLERW